MHRITFSQELAEHALKSSGRDFEIKRIKLFLGKELSRGETSSSGAYAIIDRRKGKTLRVALNREIAELLCDYNSRLMREAFVRIDGTIGREIGVQMPCYQVQTCTCELNKADVDLLHKALVAEGWTVYKSSGTKTLTFTKGGVSGSYRGRLEFSYSSQKPDTDAIKRAYSKEVIIQKAADYAEDGWELKEDGDDWWLENRNGSFGATVQA